MARTDLLKDLLAKRILVIDGAMGTQLQNQNLSAADFGGEEYLGCNDYLVLTKPSAVGKVHEDYLKAGADIIETCTFGGTACVLDEYNLGNRAYDLNYEAAKLARGLCDKYETKDKPRFVAGSMGPTTKALSLTGGITFDELVTNFALQAEALMEGGSDYLLLETQMDTLNTKAGIIGCQKAFAKLGRKVPIAVSGTVERSGTMLAGQDAASLYASVEHADLLYVGLNCATGPDFMTDHIRTLAKIAGCGVACVPNAGLPNEYGLYDETPDMLAAQLGRFADAGWLNVTGGCCGTSPAHIAKIVEMAAHHGPRCGCGAHKGYVSGIDLLEMDREARPYLVGERTNSIGSRAFKSMIAEGKYEEASEIARRQAKAGAHIIDVCLANPDRDEKADMIAFLTQAAKKVKAPFMIDSQDVGVVEAAFKLVQGKCVLNSVNLEEGVDSPRFTGLLKLAKQYGAMVVAGCIDEVGMGVEPERKLEIATRLHKILTEDFGIAEQDIMFDALVFPCGTGDENYKGSGFKTIEGVRLISERFPQCQSTLGVSNVSFGLPPAGREVLNSVFLYHCTQAGLTSAIVNSEKLERYAAISEEEKTLCNDLIWNRGEDPIAVFAAHFRGKKTTEKAPAANLPAREKLPRCILDGSKEGLIPALDVLLSEGVLPLDIINGPLMDGMNEVGRLFNANQLIVSEVLQSAEAMKAAVAHLEPLMKGDATSTRGKLLLATVKGDVHDIGKNLVEIILGNNGYQVVNLGIKCPPDKIVAAAKEHNPDLIGLSGLLVKSAHEMVATARDLKAAGITAPILVGGAALSNNFTVKNIAPEHGGPVIYCRDAMTGLEVANRLVDKASGAREAWLAKHATMEADVRSGAAAAANTAAPVEAKEKLVLDRSVALPTPPTLARKTWTKSVQEVWRYLNPVMLYGRHLGLKGNPEALFAAGDTKALDLKEKMEALQARVARENWISVKGVVRWFPVRVQGDTIEVYSEDRSRKVSEFRFPRQSDGWGLSLSDFCHPTEWDHVALFCVTAGGGVAARVEELKQKGELWATHALQALALETAEAAAEMIHRQIRLEWGFADSADLAVTDLFKAKYQGLRVSFGYPACPRLEDQTQLFDLLQPSDIGVELTDGFMMEPEASVSALVFHHPQARYFTISPADLEKFEG